jgi:hypothetical protein
VNFEEAFKGTFEVAHKSPARTFNNTYGERLAQIPVNNGKENEERGDSTFAYKNERVNETLSGVFKAGKVKKQVEGGSNEDHST